MIVQMPRFYVISPSELRDSNSRSYMKKFRKECFYFICKKTLVSKKLKNLILVKLV